MFRWVSSVGRVFVIGACLCSLSLALAPVAHAQEAAAEGDDARTLFQRGEVAYAQGDYDSAIELWTRAYALDARPLLQWNLSQAYERLGRVIEAAAALEAYLANADPSDVHQADARARLGALRERIASTGIILRGGPEGASVTVDGEDRGRLPRPDPIQVTPGSHEVVVSAPGHDTFRAAVAVPAGDRVELAVEMTAEGDGSVEPPIAGIVLMGVGGVAVIAGAVMGGVALSQASSAPASTGPEADSARGLALGADITLGIGAACAVAGIIVTVVQLTSSSSTPAESASLEVVPFAAPGGGGVVASGRF
jgi:hypothetical protein